MVGGVQTHLLQVVSGAEPAALRRDDDDAHAGVGGDHVELACRAVIIADDNGLKRVPRLSVSVATPPARAERTSGSAAVSAAAGTHGRDLAHSLIVTDEEARAKARALTKARALERVGFRAEHAPDKPGVVTTRPRVITVTIAS